METSTAAVSLGLFVLSYLLYQRVAAADNDEFQTIARPKNVANPVGEALARGYQTVSRLLAFKEYR
jgi:hypothetical protein